MCFASLWRRALGVALGLGSIFACSADRVETSPPQVAPAPKCVPAPASTEKVVVRNDYGTLEGTLVVPEGCGPHPVALIIAGSGPTNRDGGESRMYRLLAEALAEHGVASLRYDKGGVGASRSAIPEPKDMRIEMGAHDAALFVKALGSDARLGAITVIGHSEGSLLAMLAAREAHIARFVSLAGAGRPIGTVLREQLARRITDAALLARAREIIDALERGDRVDDVPKELRAVFDPTVQGYLISWMKLNPADEIRSAPFQRVVVVQGATDVQVPLEDAKLLAAARPDARLVVIEKMSHVLKHAEDTTAPAQKRAYTDPSLPIVPELVTEISGLARGGDDRP
jgi:pimeloyl-ACP methyl ester carboxylesterase